MSLFTSSPVCYVDPFGLQSASGDVDDHYLQPGDSSINDLLNSGLPTVSDANAGSEYEQWGRYVDSTNAAFRRQQIRFSKSSTYFFPNGNSFTGPADEYSKEFPDVVVKSRYSNCYFTPTVHYHYKEQFGQWKVYTFDYTLHLLLTARTNTGAVIFNSGRAALTTVGSLTEVPVISIPSTALSFLNVDTTDWLPVSNVSFITSKLTITPTGSPVEMGPLLYYIDRVEWKKTDSTNAIDASTVEDKIESESNVIFQNPDLLTFDE